VVKGKDMNRFQVFGLVAQIFNLLESEGIKWAENSKGKVTSINKVYTGMDKSGNIFFIDFSRDGEVYVALEQPTLDNHISHRVFFSDYKEKVQNLLNIT